MRYLSSLVFLVVGGFVAWFNHTHEDRVILFPFLDRLFPSLDGNLPDQGRLTAILFLVVGIVLAAWAILMQVRERRAGR